MVTQPTPRRFTVDEYYAMGAAGILRPDERTELIEGKIITMPPIGPGHAEGVWAAARQLERRLDDVAYVRTQAPIHLPDGSEPKPDVLVARLLPGGYRTRHPEPDDIHLVIEVSDTTLSYDRHIKLPLYARAGLRESWIINLPDECIELYRDPREDGYRQTMIARPGGMLSLFAFPDILIPALALLP